MFDSGIIDLLYIMYTGGMFKKRHSNFVEKRKRTDQRVELARIALKCILVIYWKYIFNIGFLCKTPSFCQIATKKFIQSIHSSQGIVCLQNVAKNCTKISPPYLLIGHDALVVDPKCKI